ncbi:hypothetical protein JCM11641_006174 [Rhodosporidiobolus odoratus]
MKALPSLSTTTASSPTRSSSGPSPLVSSTSPPATEEPSPTDLLLATPPTLLKLFALCAPAIHAAATFSQLITWTHPNFFGSLLVLLGWWGICLFGRVTALYGLNAAILLFIGRKYLTTTRRKGGKVAATSPTALRHRSRPATLSPAAYAQLINSANIVATHVQAFRTSLLHPLSSYFSFVPLRPSTPAPAYETAWFLLTSYPFYLLLTFFIPLRYLFLIAGSVVILWQAPFFTTLRTLLWRSAFVRWTCKLGLGVLRGGTGLKKEWGKTRSGLGIAGLLSKQGTPRRGAKEAPVEERPVKKPRRSSSTGPAAVSAASSVEAVRGRSEAVVAEIVAEEEVEVLAEPEAEEEEDVQVQFTVFENQRWWVGLDWTHALLPGERASWTDPANNPANPPSSFTLPPPSVAYTPSPTKTDPLSRLKQTTEWRWLYPEWSVLRSAIPTVALAVPSTSSTGAAAISPSLPSGASPDPSSSADAAQGIPAAPPSHPTLASSSQTISRLAAAAGVSLPPSLSPELPPTTNPTFTSPTSLAIDDHSPLFATWSVDDEGWQYGDNHWEKMGQRGGLGKYTRRRVWVRRAGLVERTERVGGVQDGTTGDGKKGREEERSRERERERKEKVRRESPSGIEMTRRNSSKGAESLRRRKSTTAKSGGVGKEDGQAG